MLSITMIQWGVPVQDDKTLFEFLILEGELAGLAGQRSSKSAGLPQGL
jgi:3-methyladenine DNA glycosylase Tag